MKRARALLICLIISVFFPSIVFAVGNIYSLKVEGPITPVTAEYVLDGLKLANEARAELVVMQLDTPGGLDTSMRSIVKEVLNSEAPITVYVSPKGARAASAGVFITLAAHIAAMAPGTNIGAAHPVGLGGGMDPEMSKKVENDAAAYIRSIAEKRGRNVQWAEKAVRQSVSVSEQEAKNLAIIDIVADDFQDLLAKVNGREIQIDSQKKTLNTKGLSIVNYEMNYRQRLLKVLADPNIAYLLLLLGFYGLFFELSSPGMILPGVIGGISIILGFYALQVLPVNYAGLLFILLALVLFLLEIKVPSYGTLTLGGITSMILGSLMLFKAPGAYLKLSLWIVFPAALATAGFFFFLVGAVVKTHIKRPISGREGLIGAVGVCQMDISGSGKIFVHGEIWDAYSQDEIKKGERAKVLAMDGLKLIVGKFEEG